MWDVKKVMFYCDTKYQVEKHYESWFLNLCKYKTHQKIMKLGMVSLHGTYNCPIWATLYYKPLTNWSLSQPSWFRYGNMPLLWAKR